MTDFCILKHLLLRNMLTDKGTDLKGQMKGICSMCKKAECPWRSLRVKRQTGTDNLIGGEGNDILCGGEGNDALSGGYGNDSYLFNTGDGEDKIEYIEFSDGLVYAIDYENMSCRKYTIS